MNGVPLGQLCHYCQTPGTPERPIERAGENHAASGPGATIYAHGDCPDPTRPGLTEEQREALADVERRRTTRLFATRDQHGH